MSRTKRPNLVDISQRLVDELRNLAFAEPVTHVYNPLAYAWEIHKQYLERFGSKPVSNLLFGMNPGPWGMAQTGVPFGEVSFVRDWMKLEGEVQKPEREHPKRPVDGLNCPRSEVSGSRIWGWAQDNFETPEAFFSSFFIANYCPLSFMEENGRNRTPDKLTKEERDTLFPLCDRAIADTIEWLQPDLIIGVGNFAYQRALKVSKLISYSPRVEKILHPSPANPQANNNWAERMTDSILSFGIELPKHTPPNALTKGTTKKMTSTQMASKKKVSKKKVSKEKVSKKKDTKKKTRSKKELA